MTQSYDIQITSLMNFLNGKTCRLVYYGVEEICHKFSAAQTTHTEASSSIEHIRQRIMMLGVTNMSSIKFEDPLSELILDANSEQFAVWIKTGIYKGEKLAEIEDMCEEQPMLCDEDAPVFYPMKSSSSKWEQTTEQSVCCCCATKLRKHFRHHCRSCGKNVCNACCLVKYGYNHCRKCYVNPPNISEQELKQRKKADRGIVKFLEPIPGIGFAVSAGHAFSGKDHQRARRAAGKCMNSSCVVGYGMSGAFIGSCVAPFVGTIVGGAIGGAVGAVIGTGYEAIGKNTIVSDEAKKDMDDFTVKNVARNVVVGAVSCAGGEAVGIVAKGLPTSGASRFCAKYADDLAKGLAVKETVKGVCQDISVVVGRKVLPIVGSKIYGLEAKGCILLGGKLTSLDE